MPTKQKRPSKKKIPVKKKAIKRGAAITPKMGRPTGYNPQLNEKVFKLFLLGLTDKEVAESLGIGDRTFYEWRERYPHFAQSIDKGKVMADAEVAHGLYQRAKGMTLPDVHISNFQGQITVTDLTKHIAPDPKAAELWLRNRQGKKWKAGTGLDGGDLSAVLGIHIHESLKAAK